MISRSNAIDVIYDLINSGILDESIEDALNEIVTCIDYEECGMHLWNATNEDCDNLFTCKRVDKITDEYIEEQKAIVNKYRFVPAPAEKKEIKDTIECS